MLRYKETFLSALCMLAGGLFLFAAAYSVVKPYSEMLQDPLNAEPSISKPRIIIALLLGASFITAGFFLRKRRVILD